MTARILPGDEWPALSGTELETIWPYLDPATARVVVVEEDGAIIGCWAGFPLFHAEGVYIAPAHRGRASVARHLLLGMRSLAKDAGARSIITGAIDPLVAEMLLKLGAVALPGTQYALPITSEAPCPQR